MESQIQKLDLLIAKAHADKDYYVESMLILSRADVESDLKEEKENFVKISLTMTSQLSRLNVLSPSLNRQDQETVAQIFYIFENPETITAKTITGLMNLSDES